jgi:hypothetical protein
MKKFSLRLIGFTVIVLSVPASFGASDKKEDTAKAAQAQLLDQNAYKCSNCFFGANDYFYCFRVDNRILLARDQVPVFNWRDPDQNYWAKYHSAWKTWKPGGATVAIHYNDKYLWVPRTEGKDLRFRQDYTQDVFTDPACRAAVKKPSPK